MPRHTVVKRNHHQKWIRDKHPSATIATPAGSRFTWKRPRSEEQEPCLDNIPTTTTTECPCQTTTKATNTKETTSNHNLQKYRRVGRHKLVATTTIATAAKLTQKNSSAKYVNDSYNDKIKRAHVTTATTITTTGSSGKMIKTASNKLVNETKTKKVKKQTSNNDNNHYTTTAAPNWNRKRLCADHSSHQLPAKRIPLTKQVIEQSSQGTYSKCQHKNDKNNNHVVVVVDPKRSASAAAATTTTIVWTDHAYRSSKGSSSGLVRVPANSHTRICTAFARGIPCNNPACKLRHDVPKECAVPLCQFFQKNGMCFRNDCPFRHVKVSASAESCPYFASLGYCQDTGCQLKHV